MFSPIQIWLSWSLLYFYLWRPIGRMWRSTWIPILQEHFHFYLWGPIGGMWRLTFSLKIPDDQLWRFPLRRALSLSFHFVKNTFTFTWWPTDRMWRLSLSFQFYKRTFTFTWCVHFHFHSLFCKNTFTFTWWPTDRMWTLSLSFHFYKSTLTFRLLPDDQMIGCEHFHFHSSFFKNTFTFAWWP